MMKISEDGDLVIPAALLKNCGLNPGDAVELEVSRNGILVKAEHESAESIMKWLKQEHGDEMVTLTTDQILHLLK
jgi:bifunctional DNA-binding transcriptional regulator/antitoxin component of YhaV-PrlF toxin-antitoxin module